MIEGRIAGLSPVWTSRLARFSCPSGVEIPPQRPMCQIECETHRTQPTIGAWGLPRPSWRQESREWRLRAISSAHAICQRGPRIQSKSAISPENRHYGFRVQAQSCGYEFAFPGGVALADTAVGVFGSEMELRLLFDTNTKPPTISPNTQAPKLTQSGLTSDRKRKRMVCSPGARTNPRIR